MRFNDHSDLLGCHAFLGASKSSWLNYTDDKLVLSYNNASAAQRGTELHELAERLIRLGQKLPATHKTLNMYVNDAIGFKMIPEQVLYYSENCFGTADAIRFDKDLLRIHDLKTGVTPAHMEQLRIYAALFCLEYNVKPGTIHMELRMYKDDDVIIEEPQADQILPIMDKIIHFDKLIKRMKEREA